MRARYYSPDMRRFVNADILHGKLSNAVTLNRFAYANGNPVSFADPKGCEAGRGGFGDSYATYIDNLANGRLFTPYPAFDASGDDSGNSAIHLIGWSYARKDVLEYEEYINKSGILTGFNYRVAVDGYTDDWNSLIWEDFTSRSSFARAAYTKKAELIKMGIPEECIDVQRIDGVDDLVDTWEMWSGYASVASLNFYSHGYEAGPEVYKGNGDFWVDASKLNFTTNEPNSTAYAAFYGCNTANGEFAQHFANDQNVTVYAQDDYASFSYNMTWYKRIKTHDTSGDVYLVAFDSWFGLKNKDGMGNVFYPQ